jgi:molybdopterin synthase sulfur carrier subunit
VKVEVRLFAQLRDRLPDSPRGRSTLELEEGASVANLLERLEVSNRLASMVLVNGEQIGKRTAERAARQLAPGDVVAIFPALAGG